MKPVEAVLPLVLLVPLGPMTDLETPCLNARGEVAKY